MARGSGQLVRPVRPAPGHPIDYNGHGTWTTGVVVGGSAGGSAIGMAPDASWIAARVFDDQGRGTTSGIHAALQWAIDPDGDPSTDDGADVVNNSWSYGAPGCYLEFQADLAALRALDVLPVFAAGNGGPGTDTSYSPANYPEALAVGAVDGADTVLTDSSRGPSTCGGRSWVFPDLVSPGSGVRTSDLYGLWITQTGTSLAAAHVTGALALVLSGSPGLSAAEQQAALAAGAVDLGAAGPDDTHGAGRLDVAAAWAGIGSVDSAGPQTSGVAVSPSPTNLAIAPVVTATADDTATGGSAIAAAEAFVDTPGPDGTGIPLTVQDAGTAVLAQLTGTLGGSYGEGAHTVSVHARDAAGAWGPFAQAGFLVDLSAPAVTAPAAAPDPTAGSTTVTVSATASDPGGVASAEVRETGVRVPALTAAMQPADGAYGGTAEAVLLPLGVGGWSQGQHLLEVRARDVAGNAGQWMPISLVVAPADLLFADGFETGGVGRWPVVSGNARLTVTASALVGQRALEATIAGNTPSYLQDPSPAAETSYRARLWFDPHAARTETSGHTILAGQSGAGTNVFQVAYRRTGSGALQLRAGAARAGGTTWTTWSTMTTGPHAIELAWRAGSAGSLSVWVDAVSRGSLTGLANGSLRLERVRLGPSAGLGPASAGTETYDAFASTRTSALGP